MGYSTDFVGELKFANEMTVPMLAALKSIFGEDAREHPDWLEDLPKGAYIGYIDLELLPDFSGIKWDGSEKTYGLEHAVNIVTAAMRKQWPEFRLMGHLNAQGEEFEDRWTLALDASGHAEKKPVAIPGTVITCPHCEEKFAYEATP